MMMIRRRVRSPVAGDEMNVTVLLSGDHSRPLLPMRGWSISTAPPFVRTRWTPVVALNTTHWPSGEHRAPCVCGKSVSWYGSLPSALIRHRFCAVEPFLNSQLNTIWPCRDKPPGSPVVS